MCPAPWLVRLSGSEVECLVPGFVANSSHGDGTLIPHYPISILLSSALHILYLPGLFLEIRAASPYKVYKSGRMLRHVSESWVCQRHFVAVTYKFAKSADSNMLFPFEHKGR